jgi:hypothetical protein
MVTDPRNQLHRLLTLSYIETREQLRQNCRDMQHFVYMCPCNALSRSHGIRHVECVSAALSKVNMCSRLKGLSHLADLARRSYTGAHIWRLSRIGAGTAAQRYHIAKNGSTLSGHRQNSGAKFSNGDPTVEFF